MIGIAKILIGLMLIILIAVLTIYFNVIGFLIGVGMAIVLNGTFNRIDQRKKQP
ncbi:hypothetical protein [Pseudoalteromonas tetraodonis]|uniref:hypothetical protein n=1 Tax=Pseudoalteromonas tetraodonis TaxID=43659 RepID=UPI0030032269